MFYRASQGVVQRGPRSEVGRGKGGRRGGGGCVGLLLHHSHPSVPPHHLEVALMMTVPLLMLRMRECGQLPALEPHHSNICCGPLGGHPRVWHEGGVGGRLQRGGREGWSFPRGSNSPLSPDKRGGQQGWWGRGHCCLLPAHHPTSTPSPPLPLQNTPNGSVKASQPRRQAESGGVPGAPRVRDTCALP